MKTYREFIDEKLVSFGGKVYPKFNQVVILAGGAGCFSGDTLVKTEHSYKKIKDVQEGEKVWTFNEDTKKYELNVVDELLEYSKHPQNLLELQFDNGETVICTESHEFFINEEWVKAKDIPLEP